MTRKIHLTYFLAILLISFNGFGKGYNYVDSLTNQLTRKNSDKLKLRNDIAEFLLKENDSSLIEHINQGLASVKGKSTDQVFRSYELLGKYYLKSYQYNKASKNFFTALSLAQSQEQKASVSIYISAIKYETEEIMESLEYLRQAKGYLLNTNNNELWYRAYYNEGLCYFQIDDFDLAQLRWEKAKLYAEKTGKSKYLSEINAMLGEVSLYKNEYLKSLNYLNLSVLALHADTLTNGYALALLNLSHLHKINKNYNEATQYLNAASTLFELMNNKKGYARVLMDKGNIDIANNNVRMAYRNFINAIEIYKEISNEKGIAQANIGLAKIYLLNGDLNQAFISLNEANRASKDNFSYLLLADIHMEYCTYYYKKNNFDSALHQAQLTDKLLKKSNNYFRQYRLYQVMSEINYELKDYKSAAQNLRKSLQINEKINNIINSQEYKNIQSQHEVERKQSLIEVLTQEKEYRDETLEQNRKKIEKQKAFIILGIIIFGFLIILAFVLASGLNMKRKANKKLQKSNSQIAFQKEEIEQQKQHLQKINDELEQLSIIARETDNAVKIMNPVGRITWVNEGYTRLYGYTLTELQDVDKMSLLGSSSSVDIHSLVSVWYGDKKPITYETLHEKKNGEEIWVQTTLTPVLDEGGRISRMIAIDTDISRIKKAEESIRQKNRDITSSISYAKKIQEAIMIPFDKFKEYFEESFCFYKPKSIVSGDFYWFSEQHNRIVLACADCTGHGVPGAFMSLIGISFLNKIVNEKGFVAPAIILNRMRNNIITHLHHSDTENDTVAGDGMDMSVISIDKRNNTLEFAGAMNPVYLVRNNDLIVLKPDRMPVGFFDNEQRPFSSTSISLKPGDHIYMFTDGYYDQFGGEDDGKMKTQKFKKLLTSCFGKSAEEQRKEIISYFNTWKGYNTQVDDILVMGIVID